MSSYQINANANVLIMIQVIRFVLNIISIFILLILTLFSLRRIVFGVTAFFSRFKKTVESHNVDYQPTVTVLIPCHNEELVIGKCLESLIRLDYPKQMLEIVVCDDGSTDNTKNIALAFEKSFNFIHTFSIPLSKGKAAAMNLALKKFHKGEIVYIFDADSLARPDCLHKAISHFSSPFVNAVCGCQPIRNKYDNLISYYAFIERLVFKWNAYANDRLMLGAGFPGSNCGIRRNFLEKIGCFDENCLIEDASLEVKIYENLSKVKYEPLAITEQEVPNTFKGYYYQRLGWAKGMDELSLTNYKKIILNKRISFVQKLRCNIMLFAYWDHIFLAVAVLMTLCNLLFTRLFLFPFWLWAIFLGAPILQVIAYLLAEKISIGAYMRLPAIIIFVPFELFVVIKGFFEDFLGKRKVRYKTPRKNHRN